MRVNLPSGRRAEIAALIEDVTKSLPAEYAVILRNNRERLAWQVGQVVALVRPGGRLIDLGAGVLPFMLLCQRLGFACTIVDDYQDATYEDASTAKVLELNAGFGVEVVNGNLFDLDYAKLGPFDMVTSHDSMEHWHNSPKRIFHALRSRLSPGGLFWIGVPNCVNLRKRITIPFGYGKWSGMDQWYELEIFRDHVREPDVGDLVYIGNDLALKDVQIEGRNWIGRRHKNKYIKMMTPLVDAALQLFPSLCSDIYLYGWA